MPIAARVMLAVLLLGGLGGPASGPRAAGAAPQEDSSPSPASSPPAPGYDPLEEFVPREKVPADSVVSFPVDI